MTSRDGTSARKPLKTCIRHPSFYLQQRQWHCWLRRHYNGIGARAAAAAAAAAAGAGESADGGSSNGFCSSRNSKRTNVDP